MNIEQAIPILKRQLVSKRTPHGRPINNAALSAIDATLQDVANHKSEITQCEGCGFVISILLTEAGCPNCGVEELTTKVIE